MTNKIDELEAPAKTAYCIDDPEGHDINDKHGHETSADWVRRAFNLREAHYCIANGLFYNGNSSLKSEISLNGSLDFWEISVLISEEGFELSDFSIHNYETSSIDEQNTLEEAYSETYYFKWGE